MDFKIEFEETSDRNSSSFRYRLPDGDINDADMETLIYSRKSIKLMNIFY